MKYLLSIITLFSIVLLIACGPSDRSIEKKSLEELMALHDSTMSHSGYIIPLQNELRRMIDSTATKDSDRKKSDSLFHQLDVADKLMYEWMHQYKSDFSVGKDHKFIMEYLDSEVIKMKFIQKKTEETLAETRKFLKK